MNLLFVTFIIEVPCHQNYITMIKQMTVMLTSSYQFLVKEVWSGPLVHIVMTFSCSWSICTHFPLCTCARSGLTNQPTSRSHFTSHHNSSDKCTTGRGIYTHTNTCLPARVQHADNDIRLHNRKWHNTMVNTPHISSLVLAHQNHHLCSSNLQKMVTLATSLLVWAGHDMYDTSTSIWVHFSL